MIDEWTDDSLISYDGLLKLIVAVAVVTAASAVNIPNNII